MRITTSIRLYAGYPTTQLFLFADRKRKEDMEARRKEHLARGTLPPVEEEQATPP